MNAQEKTQQGRYFRTWKVDQPVGAIVLIHGLGEHCQRYDHVAAALNKAKFSVYSMDLPGHGQSEGLRGHIDSFNEYSDSTLILLHKAEQELPQVPKFLIGHSMGGLIATQFLLEYQDRFRGAILSGPAIQSPQEPPAWQIAVIKSVAQIFPKAKMLALDATGISKDPEVVEKYMNDPLISQEKLSARFLVAMTGAMNEVKARCNEITLPLLLMHGSLDPMTSPEGTDFLYQNSKSSDKEKHIWDGLLHEIFNEPEKDKVLTLMVDWLKQRSTSA